MANGEPCSAAPHTLSNPIRSNSQHYATQHCCSSRFKPRPIHLRRSRDTSQRMQSRRAEEQVNIVKQVLGSVLS